MFRWFLNFAYLAALVVLLPLLVYRFWRRGHRTVGWQQKFWGTVPGKLSANRPVWFHAVSVGEVNLLGPLVRHWQSELPTVPVIISTSTATGNQVAAQRYPDLPRIFWPFDFTWSVTRALERVRPRAVILAELELWPNFLAIAATQKIPVIVVNGRLSERSWRAYRRWRWLVRPMLERLELVCAQDATYGERFVDLGLPAERLCITGNLKFDGINQDREFPAAKSLVNQYGIDDRKIVWVAGSTQPDEDQIVLDVYQRLVGEGIKLQLVIAPRHPEKVGPLLARLAADSEDFVLRSSGQRGTGAGIIVVDVLGELSAWWARADVAFVGGSLNPRGGQNMIEPAAVGAAVCFGPNTQNFRETVLGLLAAGGAEQVENPEQLYQFVQRMVDQPEQRRRLGQQARTFVNNSQGALQKTWSALQRALPCTSNSALRGI